MATEFENILSKRSKKLKVKPQEFDAIRSLVNMLLGIGVEIKDFENFFLSFTIEQIGKELYKYTSKGLQLVGVEDLKDTMQLFQESLGENFESLFQVNSYLISPLNSHQNLCMVIIF